MRILFRADASVNIGNGHLMRCLALADEMSHHGMESFFACCEVLGENLSIFQTIEAHGHSVLFLKASTHNNNVLPIGFRNDADQIISFFQQIHFDWVVVDHYQLDYKWENLIKDVCSRILVIDDLANRKHLCSLLLDQTAGRATDDYANLLDSNVQLLTGSKYALLRDEFRKHRKYSLKRRLKGKVSLDRILISMGGSDSENLTSKVLLSMQKSTLSESCEVVVVLGGSFPWKSEITQLASKVRFNVEVVINVSNIAALMSDSDLSIGAAGITTWERCCLGLPSITIKSAENQNSIIEYLKAEKLALVIDNPENISNLLPLYLNEVNHNLDLLSDLALKTKEVCDGDGCLRVLEKMFDL